MLLFFINTKMKMTHQSKFSKTVLFPFLKKNWMSILILAVVLVLCVVLYGCYSNPLSLLCKPLSKSVDKFHGGLMRNLYDNTNVVELSNDYFNLHQYAVLPNYLGKKGLMIFYQSSCAHCINMAEDVIKVGKMIDKSKHFVCAVNCGNNENIANFFKITGYPTIKVVGLKGDVSDYDGSRDARSLARIIMG